MIRYSLNTGTLIDVWRQSLTKKAAAEHERIQRNENNPNFLPVEYVFLGLVGEVREVRRCVVAILATVNHSPELGGVLAKAVQRLPHHRHIIIHIVTFNVRQIHFAFLATSHAIRSGGALITLRHLRGYQLNLKAQSFGFREHLHNTDRSRQRLVDYARRHKKLFSARRAVALTTTC